MLTKKLGVGIICTANRIGEASEKAMKEAVNSMTTLNKAAAEISRKYEVHACTDVTGFGFLGHLHEMMDGKNSCRIFSEKVPVMDEVMAYADEFFLTAAAQKNRNYAEKYVEFQNCSFAMEEVLFDPQTSGGLLLAVAPDCADAMTVIVRTADRMIVRFIRFFLRECINNSILLLLQIPHCRFLLPLSPGTRSSL